MSTAEIINNVQASSTPPKEDEHCSHPYRLQGLQEEAHKSRNTLSLATGIRDSVELTDNLVRRAETFLWHLCEAWETLRAGLTKASLPQLDICPDWH